LAEGDDAAWSAEEVSGALYKLEKSTVRGRIIAGEARIDGRDTKTVRPIDVKVGVLPRAHGSAVFTRGETQAIVTTTLGTGRDAQIIDAIEGERKENFMLHYNFPPFCVGETGFVGSPKRREIGHGKLAKRGIQAVMPAFDDFGYVLRVVSEITESNGSSSMASVCGTSLSLMDAGVPIKAPVAGVAMGLVKEGDNYAVLTDILGDEDHLGDMDFKVAGTDEGVTALQMDIKIQGINEDIIRGGLEKAYTARQFILGKMTDVIASARGEVSAYAPRIITIQINPEKIRDIIGKGGATIRKIQEETGTEINVEDDGTVEIAAVSSENSSKAVQWIESLTREVEVGALYLGKVTRIMGFGAFVEILPGKEGLVRIGELADYHVPTVEDVVQVGDEIMVVVIEIDRQGRINLSRKAAMQRHLARGNDEG
jgi:polyribonucleotide nucleotidyltransferase